ncbi:hypothetical protein [Methylobacterium trifolii]|uniref:Uncharacterized protein n=1 Tax=Methylobacterium trifolii TaxID=1003092 RepID=A0ABQ4U5T1_9HYPH|nr:hypothetical protein [Methylobacterium trifolii]GJE62522.1 hypothetical protein MPOCJGCO_4655 [Methylobacterium trifolii]
MLNGVVGWISASPVSGFDIGTADVASARGAWHPCAFNGLDLWKRAKSEATQKLVRERDEATALRREEAQDREHLLGIIETLQAENAALKTKGVTADQNGERLQNRLVKFENQPERFRAEEFWDRVMHEVQDIIPDGSAMTPAEILPEIRTWTVRGAVLHKESLTLGVLKKKTNLRVTHGRYFALPQECRYSRKAG